MSKSSGNNGSDLVQKSAIPGAIVMPQDQHYFLQEKAFTQSQAYVFGTTETKHFLIDPTPYNPDSGQDFGKIIIEVPSIFAEAGPLIISFYRDMALGTAVSTPLVVPSFNRVATSTRPPQMVLSSIDKAPDTVGTLFSQIVVPASATGGGQQAGFNVSESLPFALDITKKTYMSVLNKNGADTDVGIRWSWFEI